jgi:hypothetical protein
MATATAPDPAFEILKHQKPYTLSDKRTALEAIVDTDFFGCCNEALQKRDWNDATGCAQQICKIYERLERSAVLRNADPTSLCSKWSPAAAAIREMVEQCRKIAAEKTIQQGNDPIPQQDDSTTMMTDIVVKPPEEEEENPCAGHKKKKCKSCRCCLSNCDHKCTCPAPDDNPCLLHKRQICKRCQHCTSGCKWKCQCTREEIKECKTSRNVAAILEAHNEEAPRERPRLARRVADSKEAEELRKRLYEIERGLNLEEEKEEQQPVYYLTKPIETLQDIVEACAFSEKQTKETFAYLPRHKKLVLPVEDILQNGGHRQKLQLQALKRTLEYATRHIASVLAPGDAEGLIRATFQEEPKRRKTEKDPFMEQVVQKIETCLLGDPTMKPRKIYNEIVLALPAVQERDKTKVVSKISRVRERIMMEENQKHAAQQQAQNDAKDAPAQNDSISRQRAQKKKNVPEQNDILQQQARKEDVPPEAQNGLPRQVHEKVPQETQNDIQQQQAQHDIAQHLA